MISNKDVELYKSWQKSPIKFVCDMWNLTPQPLKEEYKAQAIELTTSKNHEWSNDFTNEWFTEFNKGEHITWQQWLLLISVERAIKGIDKKRIAVESGHGTGKSTTLSWLIIWFLFCFKDAQVPCTAPTSSQMHDVLWKELSKWIQKLKPEIKAKFSWSSEYLRITESPETWFARAKTAKKEAPEALAGMHGDFIMFVIDEACHDKETQILTDSGWKYFYNLLSLDKVLTMNDKGIAEYQKPTHYHEYNHNGDMIKLDRRGVNMFVTPNHNLWAKTKKAGYRKLRADGLTGTDMYMDRTILWEGKPAKDIEMVKLYAWFISEGSFSKVNGKNYSVVISQNIEKNRLEIIETIKKLGYKPSIYKNSINIHSRELCKKLEECGEGFYNKTIPIWIKELDVYAIDIFLDTFVKGDGYTRKNRDIIYTSSPILSGELQELVLKTGKNSVVSKRLINGKTNWIVNHFGTSSCDGFVITRTKNDNNAKVNRRVSKKEHYKGKVYCVTVPNGLVMTRRYGYAVWSGNSGVPEEVFNTAEGALTQENILVIMISNHTRLTGYFHNSHTGDSLNWQNLSFNSEQSPIVDNAFVQRILEKHGKDSDEYKIRVQGTSPNKEGMDDKGYVPLLAESDINFVSARPFIGETRLGVDPSGEGQDVTSWVARDNFVTEVLGKELISNSKSIAKKTMTWMTERNIKDRDIMLDSFGEGSDVSKEMALSDSRYNIGTVNVGQSADDEIYLNLRAEAFFRLRDWFKKGGSIVDSPLGRELAKELLAIKYRRNEAGKIQIMPKRDMKKEGIASPNHADGCMLTFVKITNKAMGIVQTAGVQPFYDGLGY